MAKKKTITSEGTPYILEFRELLDENIMLILNGKEFHKRRKQGNYTIDLKGPNETIDVDNLIHYLWRHEREEYALADIKAEIMKMKKGTMEAFLAFLKKYGFRALELPMSREVFMATIARLRDKDYFTQENEDYKELKKFFNSMISALIHVDKKPKLLTDFTVHDFVEYCIKTKLKADSFYKAAYSFCKDCGKAKSYSACKGKIKCIDILEHFEGKYKKGTLEKLLKSDNQSKYTEEIMIKHFNMDRSRYYKVRKSADSIIEERFAEELLKENKK